MEKHNKYRIPNKTPKEVLEFQRERTKEKQ